MRTLPLVIVAALLPIPGFAQTSNSATAPPAAPQAQTTTPGDSRVLTSAGHELNVGFAGYNYVEPGDTKISIHGPKFNGEYTGVMPFGQRWFIKSNARGSIGNTTYDGWCAPWMIVPNSASPNGWALDIGDYSPCSESGNKDWYVETRGLVGKDFIAGSWAWSPEAGLGFRYLSNSLVGVDGYRTQKYLYVPLGLTARTKVGSQGLLSFNFEYDLLLRGWQNSHQSLLGGGVVPATEIAPEFTIDGFSDISFDQHTGWAVRGSARYQFNRRLFVEPYFVYWEVDDSEVNTGTATFTVNGITVQQQLGFLEPFNTTREVGVKIGFRF